MGSPPQANEPECTRMYPNVPRFFFRMYPTMVSVRCWKASGYWRRGGGGSRVETFRRTTWQSSTAQELIPGSSDFARCQGCEEDIGAQLPLRQFEQVSAIHVASSCLLPLQDCGLAPELAGRCGGNSSVPAGQPTCAPTSLAKRVERPSKQPHRS